MPFNLLRKWLWFSVMDKGQNLWLRKKDCDSETHKLDLPSGWHLFDAGRQWYPVGAKNEKNRCKSVNSHKLKMDLLVSCQGTRGSCQCRWDGSSRKERLFSRQHKRASRWVIYRELSDENRTTTQKFLTLFLKTYQVVLSLPPKKFSSDRTHCEYHDLNEGGSWFAAVEIKPELKRTLYCT